jgi:hypothetical protein
MSKRQIYDWQKATANSGFASAGRDPTQHQQQEQLSAVVLRMEEDE